MEFIERDLSLPTEASAKRQWSIVLDKGTLDYLICQDMTSLATYLHNAFEMCKDYYVLVSFRSPALMKALAEEAGFVLEDEWTNVPTPGFVCLFAVCTR